MVKRRRHLLALLACSLFATGCSPRGLLGIVSDEGAGGATGSAGMSTGAEAGMTSSPSTSLACDGLTPVAPLSPTPLENVEDCEVLSYPLAFLAGSTDSSSGEVVVELAGETRAWPIYDGRYKALVKLSRGENHLHLRVGDTSGDLRLIYQPPGSPQKVVRLFVYLGSDGSGQLDAPPGVETELDDALARVRLDGLLWQTFFAEALLRSRQQQSGARALRRTFALELDGQDEPVVHVLRHDTMTQAELWQRDAGLDDWGDVVRLVNQQQLWPVADSLHIGFSLITHVDPDSGETRAAVCAGNGDPSGGGVGLCGGSNLIAHAPGLDQLVASFSASALTDPQYIAEDSQQRGSYWAAYATTLGCALSEGLRGLGLSYAPSGLFSPDCGHINRFFMPYELDELGQQVAVTPQGETADSGGDWFHPASVQELETSPFLY